MVARAGCSVLAVAVVVFASCFVNAEIAVAKKCDDCARQRPPKAGTMEAYVLEVRKMVARSKFGEAEALARKAERLAGRNVDARAKALKELGYVLSSAGKYDAAITAYEQSLELSRPRARTTAELDDIAVQLQQLGGLQRRAGQRAAARRSMDTAAETAEKAHGKNAEISKLFRQAARAFPAE